MADEPAWSIGIEEEYLIVERESGALITEQPPGILEKVADLHHGIVARELFSSQLEIGTGICTDFKHLRADIGLLRLAVTEAADEYGLAPIAASSHPFASPQDQKVTEGARYQALADDLQGVSRGLVISGLHVHVGIEDPDLRVDLMNQVSYFLPHLLALSTSSPFWEGRDTGLKSYRMAMFRSLPRTGLPEKLDSWAEYRRHVDVLVQAGVIEDSTKVWWDIRPSERYPTLEMRVTDLPTRMEDTVCVAALYVCLLRMLWRLKVENRRWRSYANFLVSENLWRAERYGISDGLIDFGKGELVPLPDLVEEMIELVRPDAEALDCVGQVEHARTIYQHGTSADRQLAVYYGALEDGASNDEALNAVVQALIADTLAPPET
ncbi:MAG: carboxylate-amine ligase [bacterium]|nr:carboxylate-amine ligase [bacterium]MCY3890197.1 carboxylate-amine ligase [bacterium]MCY3961107.1 carboxylate-amine ligase [bacterium]